MSALRSVPTGTLALFPQGVRMTWIGTWSCAQVGAADSGRSRDGFRDQTLRSILRISAGGSALRIRLSNVFGARPLTIGAPHVAVRRTGAATVPGTSCAVTFAGQRTAVIPPGQRLFSDPVPLRTEGGADLAVSLGLPDGTGPASWHPAALTTSYQAEGSGHGADADGRAFARTSQSWYFLDGV